jgi:membrane-associated protease RseP (regulator of RpoE activity)
MMRKFPFLHVLLFVLTILSTIFAGALHQGVNLLKTPQLFYKGIPFSATLIIILLSHELSHYFASKKHHTVSTLPYFIPAPTLIGTFGAVIKMKSPILSRSALVDIGASGPIVGFIFALIACIVGLQMSYTIVRIQPGMEGFTLGDSLLFYALSKVFLHVTPPRGFDIVLHPVAFAGWIGLLVTSLNLMPAGQLDGGHISYAFLGPKHRVVSILLVLFLIFMGFFYVGWLVWAGVLLILGLRHPPVYRWETPLDPKRRLMGLAALIIFIITFMPEPFKMM